MTKRDRFYFARMTAALLLLTTMSLGCGPASEANTGEGKTASTPPAPGSLHSTTIWSHVLSSGSWTAVALQLIREKMPSLEKARDVAQFCPDYAQATRIQKEVCWLRIIGGIVKFESGFRPGEMYRERNGVYSIGLMSLSPGECSNAPRTADLKDPIRNLICGVNMMSSLIARDGYLDGPKGQRGAGTYWSVIRRPYSVGHARHGRKEQIIQLTKVYRALAIF